MIERVPSTEPQAHRPRFAPGYGVPSSSDGLLPFSWATDRLAAARTFWLATTKPDGGPHAMPVWGLWVDGSLVFSTSPNSRKGRNLARDPRAVMHVERDDDVIVLEGDVEQIALNRELAELYEAKYDFPVGPESPDERWYRLQPRVAYAWDRSFPRTVTRFSFGSPDTAAS
jgi:PPOX class probable F420-dependent enzyme